MSEEPRSFVKNAADPEQVKEGGTKERIKRRQELDDIRYLIQQPHFRRFIWRILSYCNVFSSIFSASAHIYHNAGKQDVGHLIVNDITDADPDSFIKMLIENKKEQ